MLIELFELRPHEVVHFFIYTYGSVSSHFVTEGRSAEAHPRGNQRGGPTRA